MKKIVLLIVLTLTLNGCLLPIGIAVGIAAGTIVYDKRSSKTIIKDRGITQNAQNAVDEDLSLRGKTHILISTFNGIVLMVGQAETNALRIAAYRDVASVKGVRKIYMKSPFANQPQIYSAIKIYGLPLKLKP